MDGGQAVSIQTLTYAELAEVWGVSKDAARKKVEGLRLPRTRGNDGRARVQIDLGEVTHTPKPKMETGGGDLPETTPGDRGESGGSPALEVQALQARISDLQAELTRERCEREKERERSDRLALEIAPLAHQLVETERQKGEAEKIAAVAEAQIGHLQDRLAMAENANQAEVTALRAQLTEMKARPWWRRLAG